MCVSELTAQITWLIIDPSNRGKITPELSSKKDAMEGKEQTEKLSEMTNTKEHSGSTVQNNSLKNLMYI